MKPKKIVQEQLDNWAAIALAMENGKECLEVDDALEVIYDDDGINFTVVFTTGGPHVEYCTSTESLDVFTSGASGSIGLGDEFHQHILDTF